MYSLYYKRALRLFVFMFRLMCSLKNALTDMQWFFFSFFGSGRCLSVLHNMHIMHADRHDGSLWTTIGHTVDPYYTSHWQC